MITDGLHEAASSVSACVVVHEAVAEAILQKAEEGECDLLVIGASNEWQVKKASRGGAARRGGRSHALSSVDGATARAWGHLCHSSPRERVATLEIIRRPSRLTVAV